MSNYDHIFLTLHKYQNYLIPEIPKILTQYIVINEQYHNILLEKKFNIDNLLEYISDNFLKTIEITEDTILTLSLKYFNIFENNHIPVTCEVNQVTLIPKIPTLFDGEDNA